MTLSTQTGAHSPSVKMVRMACTRCSSGAARRNATFSAV